MHWLLLVLRFRYVLTMIIFIQEVARVCKPPQNCKIAVFSVFISHISLNTFSVINFARLASDLSYDLPFEFVITCIRRGYDLASPKSQTNAIDALAYFQLH